MRPCLEKVKIRANGRKRDSWVSVPKKLDILVVTTKSREIQIDQSVRRKQDRSGANKFEKDFQRTPILLSAPHDNLPGNRSY